MNRDSVGSASFSERQFNIEPSVHELYVELLCKYDSSQVPAYLQAADGYRMEQTLQVS